jgi:hypothetical protein
MSLLYLDEAEFKNPSLKTIIIGNENSNYINEKGGENFVSQVLAANNNDGKPLLQVYDITNMP